MAAIVNGCYQWHYSELAPQSLKSYQAKTIGLAPYLFDKTAVVGIA